jgi:hypothetical protein
MSTKTVGTNFFTKYTSTVDAAFTNLAGNAALVRCSAANLPTDAGYAIGCILQATNTGVLYYNTGTTSVASFTAVNAGSAALTLPSALTDASTTTGISLSLTSSAITTGQVYKAINGNTTNFTTGAALFYGDMGTATAGNGLVITGSGAYLGTGLAILNTGAMVSGIGLSVISTTGLTTGSLIRVTSSTASAISSNGAVSIRSTGAFTSTTVGYVDILSSAAIAGTVMSVASSSAMTSGIILQVLQTGATTTFTGSVVSLTGSHTSGSGNTLLVTDVSTSAGNAVKIVNNALVAGTSAALLVSHATSVLGAGNSLVRISSSSADTGSTTGTLLDLAQSGTVAGNVAVLLTDSSADTGARYLIKSSVTAAAAVAAVPYISSNVAVTGTGSKFTKHIVLADGTKTTTIWLSQDATTPNGNLTGAVGDICLNGPSGRMFYCATAGTTWTACNA